MIAWCTINGWLVPAIWWVIKVKLAGHQCTNTSSAFSTHYFFCTGLSRRLFHSSSSDKNWTSIKKILRDECWVVLEALFHFCIVNKKHAPLAVQLHAFFRGSCSACSPVRCTLYANDSFRTAQQQIDAVFSRNVYCAPGNACNTVIWWCAYVPTDAHSKILLGVRFFSCGCELGARKTFKLSNRPNNWPESSRFRFRLFPSKKRKPKTFFGRLDDDRPIPKWASVPNTAVCCSTTVV